MLDDAIPPKLVLVDEETLCCPRVSIGLPTELSGERDGEPPTLDPVDARDDAL